MAGAVSITRLEEGLTAEENVRSLTCAAEVERVLKSFDCMIVTAPIIAGEQVFTEIHVLPRQPRRPFTRGEVTDLGARRDR